MSYKVKKGDTLSSIAKAHNMSLAELLQLNGISKDKANHINVGQELNIGQASPLVKTAEFQIPTVTTPLITNTDWQFTPKPKDTDMGIPYAPGYTKADFVVDNAKTIQEQLVAAGYNVGNTGVDGKWGKNSQVALDRALAEGYILKGNQLIKPTLKSKKTPAQIDSSNTVLVARNQPQNPTQETPTTEELQQLYQQGPGSGQILGSYLYHILAPKNWAMPHSESLKDQVAAGIRYSESLPDQKKEIDPTTRRKTNTDGSHYIGYNTWGTLSGQSGNVNEQGNVNNGASKIMGGLRYKFNEDGSVDATDIYSFNIIRDFSTLDKKGKPVAQNKKDSNDPYIGHPWKGLWYDLKQPHSDITSWNGLQDLAENFGTRQGKIRENNIHYNSGEIATRTS